MDEGKPRKAEEPSKGKATRVQEVIHLISSGVDT
jgi:hypothetical protein